MFFFCALKVKNWFQGDQKLILKFQKLQKKGVFISKMVKFIQSKEKKSRLSAEKADSGSIRIGTFHARTEESKRCVTVI